MLLLAIHNVDQATAKVPFSMIVLNDLVTRKLVPQELRIRMIIPTSGLQSVSLWDAPSIESLNEWLVENINKDCTSEIHEVQEGFTYGVMMEVARARASDKVVAGGQQAMSSIKETTALATGRIRAATDQAMQNEDVAAAMATLQSGVSAGLTKASSAMSWVSSKVKAQMTTETPPNSFSSARYASESVPVSNDHRDGSARF